MEAVGALRVRKGVLESYTDVLTADALVSAPGVNLVDPHVHMGLVAGDGGVIAWPSNMATTLAKRHLLWGEPLLAEDAHRIGVVTDLVASREEVRPRAEALAARVAALPPVAVQLTKRALNKVVQARIDELIAVELEDDELAWELDPDALWHRVPTVRGVNAHRSLQELAVRRSEGDR